MLFPGEDIQVSVADEAIVLSGKVSSNAVVLRAGRDRRESSSKSKVINMLQLPGGNESQQVMLQVRFAEVNRKALTEYGTSLFTGPKGNFVTAHRHAAVRRPRSTRPSQRSTDPAPSSRSATC